MSDIAHLMQETRLARQRYLSAVRSLTPEQAHFKPAPDVWSVVENTERYCWRIGPGLAAGGFLH